MEAPAHSHQALNLSELQFPPLSREDTALDMISGHWASLKTLRFQALPFSLGLRTPRKLTDLSRKGAGQERQGGREDYVPFPK